MAADTTPSPAGAPLTGICIVSLALNLPNPAALMRLRAMGATCHKVEPSVESGTGGDLLAAFAPPPPRDDAHCPHCAGGVLAGCRPVPGVPTHLGPHGAHGTARRSACGLRDLSSSGRTVAVAALEPRLAMALCRAVDLPDADASDMHTDRVRTALRDYFAAHTAAGLQRDAISGHVSWHVMLDGVS